MSCGKLPIIAETARQGNAAIRWSVFWFGNKYKNIISK